jgi:F-type H+-transporting ATPase subunit delta
METGMRESYGPAADRLAAYAAQASAQDLARIADELESVAVLLAREPRLRRALADPAREPRERAGLVRQLLGGKVDDEAVGLVEELVSQRWPGANSLRDAVERLAVDALLASANKAGELGEVEDELFRFTQVVDGAPLLASALGDPTVPAEQRASLVSDLLDGKARGVTVQLVRLALSGFGGRSFTASLSRLVDLVAAARERTVAYVTSAVPLTDAEETTLGEALAQRYGRQVSIRVTVDPSILGGLSVQIGSDLYDGTVLRRLTEARAALTR